MCTFGDDGGFFKYRGWLNMNKKRRLILDIIGLFFSIISIFIFTIYFGLFNISIKYIFLIGYVHAFILLSNCIKSLEYNLNTNIYKYS